MQITSSPVTTKVDPNEAPSGFIAVPKANLYRGDGTAPNFCSLCDFRNNCDSNHLTPEGKLWNCFPGDSRPDVFARRKDNCSVVFKLKKS